MSFSDQDISDVVYRLSRFLEGPLVKSTTESVYLLTNAIAATWTRLMSYDEIRDVRGALNPMHSTDAGTWSTVFVSHKWGGTNPDPDGRVLKYLKENPKEFCFIDFCCTSQISPDPYKIAAALEWSFLNRSKLKFVKITPSEKDYQLSTWCNFELVILKDAHVMSVPPPLRIANPFDTYHMMVSAHKVWDQLSDETKRSIFNIVVACLDGKFPGWRTAKHPLRTSSAGLQFNYGVDRIKKILGETW